VDVVLLHQFDLAFSGGSGVYGRALQGAARRLGHRFDVVSARHPDPYGATSCALPFDFTLTFGPERRPGERTFDELATEEIDAMADRAVDHVHGFLEARGRGTPDLLIANHVSLMALVAARLGRRIGVDHRVVSYGTDTALLLRDRRYVELFGDAARGADRVFAISAFVARELEVTLGAARIEILGGAVDDALFFPPDEAGAAAASTLGPAPTLTYFGRLVSEKGLFVLVDAVERASTRARLRVVGEGPLRPDLEARVARSPAASRIDLVGFRHPADLRPLLLDSAAVVVPSTWQEPLGLVVLEALACGVPVVASAVGGIPEMITDGEHGRLVPPGDPDALAAAIDDVLGAPGPYRAMREAVRAVRVPTYADLARRLLG
jgi:glycosyltransferase involved in cell wall biosynthesis